LHKKFVIYPILSMTKTFCTLEKWYIDYVAG